MSLGLSSLALSVAAVMATSPGQWLGPPPPPAATRLVTLAPSITQTVLALGARETLIGVSRFCEFEEVAALPRVGGFNDVAVERIIALKPQLVVIQKSPGNQQAAQTLGRLGVPVLALPLTTVEDVASAMVELGRVLGREVAAQTLVSELREARQRERQRPAGKPKRVLFVVGFTPLVVAGPGSFASELLEDCGAENAALRAATAYPTYSLERAIALAPDIVIDAADVHEGRTRMERLLPMKKVKWVTLSNKALLQPGPSLARALPSLCALLR